MPNEAKFCSGCGEKLTVGAHFCTKCGNKISVSKSAVAVKASVSADKTTGDGFSREVPVWKFIMLSIITFGIYELFWFYGNWKFIKQERGLKVSPFWRSWFSPLFAGSLAGHLLDYLGEKKSPNDFSPVSIGIFYFILSVLWKLPDPYWLISVFTFVPLLPLLTAMNSYWQKEDEGLLLKKFSWWQIILVVLGCSFMTLVVIGTFLPE